MRWKSNLPTRAFSSKNNMGILSKYLRQKREKEAQPELCPDCKAYNESNPKQRCAQMCGACHKKFFNKYL